jgi:nitrous oxidase accessory protein NosD
MMQLRALLFAVCILTIVVPIRAATYYVDAERGNDTNSGTSATAAWKTLSRVNQEKFRPGDAVLFRRGQIWREQLNFQASGEAERAITIDAYGEGTLPEISGADLAPAEGWTACQSCGANIWQAGITTQPNVVLFDGTKGIKRAAPGDVKGPNDWNWTAGTLYIYAESDPRRLFAKRGVEVGARPIGINLTGLVYITIRNVRVSAANAAPYALGANIWGIAAGRKGPSPRGLRIERNEIVNSAGDGLHLEGVQESTVDANVVANNENVGIQIYRSLEAFPVSDVTVSNNEVHHNHFIGINMAGCPAGESCRTIRNEKQLTVTRIKITGNKCYANGAGIYLHQTTDSLVGGNISHDNTDTSRKGEGYGVGLSGSSNNIVERNECYGAAHAGIELSIDISKPAVGSSNNTVRYNLVHDNGSNGLMTDYLPTQGNRFVYNMVFNHPNGSCIFANNKGHVFANNTCVNNRDGIYLYVSKTTPETGDITVKNNIIVNSQKYHMVVERGVQGPISFDNNEYFPDDGMKFDWKDSPSNFDGWRGKSGGDAKSFVADPLLRSPNPQKAEDFALRSGSPAIGKGENLGAELEQALSAQNGTQASMRATKQTAKWDLGAVQHSRP